MRSRRLWGKSKAVRPVHIVLLSATLLALQVFLQRPAVALTVNIDYDLDGTAQTGAVGVFSNQGGTFWNSVQGNTALLDEFGASTSISVAQWNITGSALGSGPELFQDSMFVDTASGGIDRHNIIGLTAGIQYDIAVYGWLKTATFGSRAAIVHSGGTSTSAEFGYTISPTLPGTEGVEYVIFSGLTPLDLGAGIFGFTITTAALDPNKSFNVFSGLEIRTTPVPIPPAVFLFGSGLLGLIGIARRKKATE